MTRCFIECAVTELRQKKIIEAYISLTVAQLEQEQTRLGPGLPNSKLDIYSVIQFLGMWRSH